MSDTDMERHIANQEYLSKLHAEKTAIDESYQPIQWFKVKHECEEPGLMTGITPTQISSTSWNSSWNCIIEARKKCTDIYNDTKRMPYFSIFKNNDGKMQWAIFEIKDDEFNTKSVKSSNFSSIELEHNDLEMNINLKGGDLAFNDKNNISIPSNYTINSGRGSCNITVKEQTSDCGRILQEKKYYCGIAKTAAITANEQSIQYSILRNVDDKLGKEGMSNIEDYTTLSSAKRGEFNKRKTYSKYGTKIYLHRLQIAIRKSKITLSRINAMLEHPSKFRLAKYQYKQLIKKRDRILARYTRLLNWHGRLINDMKIKHQNNANLHNKAAIAAQQKQNTAIKKRNCFTRKSKQTIYKKKNIWGKWIYFYRPKSVKCGFVGSGSRELVGYEPNNAFSVFNTDDVVNEGFGKNWRRSMKAAANKAKEAATAAAKKAATAAANKAKEAANKAKEAANKAKEAANKAKEAATAAAKKAAKEAANKAKEAANKAKEAANKAKEAANKAAKKAATAAANKAKEAAKKTAKNIKTKINQPIAIFLPTFDKDRTRKHARKYKDASDIYNNQVNNYRGEVSKHNRIASTNNLLAKKYKQQFSRLFNRVEGFESSPNTCNNSGVDANFQISHNNSIHNCNSESVFLKYPSLDHKKTIDVIKHHTFTLYESQLSDITPALFVSGADNCNNAANVKNQTLELNYSIKHQKENIKIEEIMIDISGNGVLKYSVDNAGTHTYILGDKSNNVNERRIIMDGNGNIKMNTDVLFTNPIQTDPNYIINGYTNKNNLSSLKSGQEIRSLKYRLTLGSAWNNSTLFYTTKNNVGNTGVYDTFNQKFKYTEHYHKTKGSTTQNVFILYKIKTYGLPTLLYENRIYANIEKVFINECDPTKGSKNLCYVRAIKDTLVANEPMNETNNVNMNTVPAVTMKTFSEDDEYKVKYIDNTVLSSVPDTINEIRIFLIKSLTDIHMKISSVMKSGVGEGFKGYDNEFRGYSTIEGYTVDKSGVIISDQTDTPKDASLRILDKLKAQHDRINTKTNKMETNADIIRTKLDVLTGYSGTIHNGSDSWGGVNKYKYQDITGDTALLKTHDDYDVNNPMIPFIFDVSGGTDYYKGKTDGKIDPRAKIDAIDEDLREMLYQQNTLYTIGSITSATFIITAILLARNSS